MVYYFLYKAGQWLALHLPLRFSYALAVFFSDVHYMLADKDRLYTMGNLRAIFPDKSIRELKKIRRTMFRNFAKYLVDFFGFPVIDESYIQRYITIKNRHYIDQSLAKKKGVILLTALS